MHLFQELQNSISKFSGRNALVINETAHTYLDLASAISKIRKAIQTNTGENQKHIGLVTNDDLFTYAAIIAVWFEGKAYVPLSPDSPLERNKSIIEQAEIAAILDSASFFSPADFNVIDISNLPDVAIDITPKNTSGDALAYMLFTSGTTGVPKGVPINRDNLTAIIHALDAMALAIDPTDRCLQMSELTFDVSITSFLYPLLKGASVYTIPRNKIKYTYAYELMEDHALTVVQLVPSLLNYLRPYFDEIDLPQVKYSLLTAEALPLDLASDWSKCVPNATIVNLYGPTENTVWSSYYIVNRDTENKSYNGMVSIGKALEGTTAIIIDENNAILPAGEKGELCLAGTQLTPNYWKNDEKNKQAFFHLDYNGVKTRFYRTGDLCRIDADGDILYMGRIDFQVKIQGFRVELSEVEFHAKSFLEKTSVAAVAVKGKTGNTEIGLAVASKDFDQKGLLESMKTKMPYYMIPGKVISVETFPLNSNGKIDRKQIELLF